MKIPGFTAEAAIYDTGAMYGMTAAPEAAATGAVVVPQQIGCTTVLNRCIGPVCANVRLCLLPPSACIRITVFGHAILNRCFP
jgi:hypothetical protein